MLVNSGGQTGFLGKPCPFRWRIFWKILGAKKVGQQRRFRVPFFWLLMDLHPESLQNSASNIKKIPKQRMDENGRAVNISCVFCLMKWRDVFFPFQLKTCFFQTSWLAKRLPSLKTNTSNLKNGWKIILSFWVSAYFQGLLLLVLGRLMFFFLSRLN